MWGLRGIRRSGQDDPTETKEDEMLVLSRKLNEKIVIDGGIVITVVKIEGGQIRLGIEAPRHIKVFREEVLAASGRESAKESLVPAGV
jgi:carbon storage regulator